MKTVKLRLPATSANLGPGFDAMALAIDLFLEIEARPASQFSLRASGRNRSIAGALSGNLMIQTYEAVLAAEGRTVVPLDLEIRNGIPVGMGCGSSAAVRLAGVALASAFGDLGWDAEKNRRTAQPRLEGHPDNVAACWYGGVTIACGGPALSVVTIPPPAGWQALLVMPENPVSTTRARGVLPSEYAREDVVANLQSVALLAAAFALGRADLMQAATRDRLHQPYRMELCPLLPILLPLAGHHGVISATLSGAGPSVLLLVEKQPASEQESALKQAILDMVQPACPVEIISTSLSHEAAGFSVTQ